MPMQIADIDPAQISAVELTEAANEHPSSGPAPYSERPMAASRGIIYAVLLSIPLWALFAFALYLLI